LGLINSFAKFGDEFFKKEKRIKGTDESDDESSDEEKRDNDDEFVE